MAKEKSELHIWYDKQPWSKPTFQTFYWRIKNMWLSREEAIKKISYKWKKTDPQLKEYRENYTWPKVSYGRFIEMYKSCWSMERAIKKWWLSIYDRYPKEYSIYIKAPYPKCSFSQFMIRYQKWKPINECLKITWVYYEPKIHKETLRDIPESWYYIDITYPKEEAKIFHKIFNNMIEELESKFIQETEPKKAIKIQEELSNITKYYSVFLIFNPI